MTFKSFRLKTKLLIRTRVGPLTHWVVLGCLLSPQLAVAQTLPFGIRGPQSQSGIQQDAATEPGAMKYTFTVLDYPGTFYTNGFGINSGVTTSKIEIVGGIGNEIASPIGYSQGFQLQYAQASSTTTETYRSVEIPNAAQQTASGVNDSGELVGYYSDSTGVVHGYLQSGGIFTTLDVPFPTAIGTSAFGIDNAGDIVGFWSDATTGHGFLLHAGTYTSFDYPGATFTIANALNNLGAIVGFYGDTSGVYHGFLLNGGICSAIDSPGATATEAYGINDAGTIVGINCLTAGCAATFETFQGFVLSSGQFSPFAIPGAVATGPVNINNAGRIVGVYHDTVGRHAFLATAK